MAYLDVQQGLCNSRQQAHIWLAYKSGRAATVLEAIKLVSMYDTGGSYKLFILTELFLRRPVDFPMRLQDIHKEGGCITPNELFLTLW